MPIPAAAIGFGMAGLGALGSLFGETKHRAPTAEELQRLFGSGQLQNEYQNIFRMLASSPAFRQLQTNIGVQGNNLSQGLTAGLARRGLTTSGVGTIAQSLGKSVSGFNQQQAFGELQGDALQQARQMLMARLQAYMQGQQLEIGTPTKYGQFLGSLLGANQNLLLGKLGQQGGVPGGLNSGQYPGAF